VRVWSYSDKWTLELLAAIGVAPGEKLLWYFRLRDIIMAFKYPVWRNYII
jgi:hypothetical protein